MRIELAPSAGFCYGVKRAVDMVEELLQKGEEVCMLGPLIHNPSFVKELSGRGANVIEDLREARPGSWVVIRSHGAGPETYQKIEKAGLRCCDATCPFVSKIHNIAAEASQRGSAVLIAGDPNHPEVEGIRSYCTGEAYVFQNLEELKVLTERKPELKSRDATAVAQTTFNADDWAKCHNFMKRVYTNVTVFDTICSATSIRQQEARELASRSDIMVIVGGKQSSNTQKLYTVCSDICPSFLVEGAGELPEDRLRRANRIGVTAGASTPACIIKEVLNTMSGLDNVEAEDIDFATALNESFKTLSTDERVRGVVVGVNPNEIQVELGTKHAGYIPLSEISDDPLFKPEQQFHVGDEIDLIVLRVNDQDGTVMLSKKRVDALKSWDEIIKANDDGSILDGVVTDVIKGGLLVSVNGMKVFVPASQSGVPKNGELGTLLNQPVRLKIIEINTGRRRAVGSIRAVQREEKKALVEKFWSEAEIGKEYTGKVKSMTSYGAFIDLGGVDGMIHVSELSWSHIKHPNEVLELGQTVRVIIKDINQETKKVSLTYADKGENPWDTFLREYKVGDITDVKIVSFMPFGSFAQIIPGIDGLIHISHIANRRIARPQDVLQLGEVVKVKIIEINEEKKRISLSIKDVEENTPDETAAQEDNPEE